MPILQGVYCSLGVYQISQKRVFIRRGFKESRHLLKIIHDQK